jgi:hypothetical protein
MIGFLVYSSEFIFLFIGWFFFLRKNQTKKKLLFFYILALLPMVLISSLKATTVGNDTQGYYDRYLGYSSKGFGEVVSLTDEPLFFSISWLASNLHISWIVFLVVLYSISYFGYGFFLFRKSNHPVFSLLFLYCFGVFLFSISGLRQCIAMGISCIGMGIFKETSVKRWLAFFCFLFIAFCFHKSSLIVTLYPLMSLIKPTKRSFCLLVYSLVVFGILSCGLIEYLCFDLGILEYGVQFTTSYWNLLFALLIFTIAALVFFCPRTTFIFQKKTMQSDILISRLNLMRQDDESANLSIDFFRGMPYLIMLILGIWSATVSRLFLYFSMPAVLVFEESLSSFKSKTVRLFLFWTFSMFFFFYFAYQCFYNHYLTTYPYDFFL